MPFDKATVDATDSANCSLYEYVSAHGATHKIYPGEYLQTWCKFPNVENLARQGCGRCLSEIIDLETSYTGYNYARQHFYILNVKDHIDVKATKPHRMLGIDKSEMWIAKKFGHKITENYKSIKKERGVKLDLDALKYIDRCNDEITTYWTDKSNTGTGSWAEAYRKIYTLPIIRTLHYLSKQKASITIYRDWLVALCDIVGGDELKKIKTDDMYPKNLCLAHDRTVERRRAKVDAELKAKFEAQRKARALMAWSDSATGLMIRAAASQEELIEEGQKLHHCVAGYAGAHAEGKTTIFFIRHIETPDVPFFTLEYKDGHVCQNRGERNCQRTPDVEAFEKKWIEHLATLNIKEKKTHGRKQNTADRVGA